MHDVLYKQESFETMGACMEVYNQLGRVFLEAVYQRALGLELEARDIRFSIEVELPVRYKEPTLSLNYRADFILFDEIILVLKAVKELSSQHQSQVLNYFNVTGKKLEILVDFGSFNGLQSKRFVM